MNDGKGTIERAFELARSGECRSIEELRRRLSKERYDAVDMHLSGGAIGKQLRSLIEAAAVDRTRGEP